MSKRHRPEENVSQVGEQLKSEAEEGVGRMVAGVGLRGRAGAGVGRGRFGFLGPHLQLLGGS